MDGHASNLSGSAYGYDMVVSLTQASINSNVNEYFGTATFTNYTIIVLGDASWTPQKAITLENLLTLSNNVNPFEITDPTDPGVATLASLKFMYGIQAQVGLPPDAPSPVILDPSIVAFTGSETSFTFNVYFQTFTVVAYAHDTSTWTYCDQSQQNFDVIMSATLPLLTEPIDTGLNTAYFNALPHKRAAINARLANLPVGSYDLHQLLFNFGDSAAATNLSIKGLDKFSWAEQLVVSNLVGLFNNTSGMLSDIPVLVFAAAPTNGTTSTNDLLPSQWQAMVDPFVDDTGKVVPYDSLSPTQQNVVTLSIYCMIGQHKLPPLVQALPLNWVDPTNVAQQSGTITLNRNILANQLLSDLTNPFQSVLSRFQNLQVQSDSPYKFTYQWLTLVGSGLPFESQVLPSPSFVQLTSMNPLIVLSEQEVLLVGISNLTELFVSVQDSTSILVELYRRVALDGASSDWQALNIHIDLLYSMNIDASGNLQITKASGKSLDQPQDLTDQFVEENKLDQDSVLHFSATVETIKSRLTDVSVNFSNPGTSQNFVFPGGNVFTFHDVYFSNFQDLVCAIDVQNLSQTLITQPSRQNEVASQPSLTYSTEMMDNYVHASILSPQSKVEALQTADGRGVLFTLDKFDALTAIEEQSGMTHQGWLQYDLTTAAIEADFSNDPNASIQTFDVGQSAVDRTIGLAMAVTSNGSDYLYACLGNSNIDPSVTVGSNSTKGLPWLSSPVWTHYPFDPQNVAQKSISIVGIMFTETTNNRQYIVVDIDRSLDPSDKNIARYYVDPSKATGYYWIEINPGIDIQNGNYHSCVGRNPHSRKVDGIYTSGQAGATSQLEYMPLWDPWGSSSPAPTPMVIPNNGIASAIAASRNNDHASSLLGNSDLYVISGDTLYYYATQTQTPKCSGVPLLTNTFLQGTSKLVVMTNSILQTLPGGGKEAVNTTTLWGLNGNGQNGQGQVYYMSCLTAMVSDPGSWSLPLPLLANIDHISPYLNVADGGNTIFATNGVSIQQIMQSETALGSMWKPQTIMVIPDAKVMQSSLQSFNSYTTVIQVSDQNQLPASGQTINLSASTRLSVYLNGLYTVLGPAAIPVITDQNGSVTIIETTENLNGTRLVITFNGTSTTINPMKAGFDKCTQFNDADTLKQAKVYKLTPKSMGGYRDSDIPVPLVDPNADITGTITCMSGLSSSYSIVSKLNPTSSIKDASHIFKANALSPSTDNLGGFFSHLWGDIVQCAKAVEEAVITIVTDAAQGIVTLTLNLAGAVYQKIAKCVEEVVSGVEWMFNEIKTGIEDVINFIKALLSWDDIVRTHDVLNNMVLQYTSTVASGLTDAQTKFDGAIQAVENDIDKWANITDWSPLGDPAKSPMSSSTQNPNQNQTSHSQLFQHHLNNQRGNVTPTSAIPFANVTEDLVTPLLDAIAQEGDVLANVYQSLSDLASDASSLSLGEIIQKIIGVLADGVLSSMQVVVDALFNVLKGLASSVMDVVKSQIYIPIISDILKAIGIETISYLDLFTWVASFAYTIIYKVTHSDAAPFPAGDTTTALATAPDWNSLLTLFGQSSTTTTDLNKGKSLSTKTGATATATDAPTHDTFQADHFISGMMALISIIFTAPEALSRTGDNDYAVPAAVSGIFSAATGILIDHLVPTYPIVSTPAHDLADACGILIIATKVIFAGPVTKFLTKAGLPKFLTPGDGRATGSVIVTMIDVVLLSTIGWHFYELSQVSASPTKTAAVLGTVNDLNGCFTRLFYSVAVNNTAVEKKEVQAANVILMSGCLVIDAGLQIAECFQDVPAS